MSAGARVVSAVTGPVVQFDLDDPLVVAHLAKALAAHLAWCHANGIEAPDALKRVTPTVVKWAKAGQDGPTLPDHGDDPQDAAVLLTIGDTATLLGCSESTVKRHVASGALLAVTSGRVRRIRRTDLDTYVANLGQDTA